MFFNKSTVLFSALALCNVVVAAQPPACLLSVVGYVIITTYRNVREER